MPDSLFGSLTSVLNDQKLADVAGRLGESEQAVKKGLETIFPTLLGGLLNRTQESGTMRQVIDLATSLPADAAKNAGSVLDGSNSAFLSLGKRLISLLFGRTEGSVGDAISASSGLKASSIAPLLSGGASLLLGVLSKRVRDEGLTATGLGSLLQGESAAIQRAIPAGLVNLVRGGQGAATEKIVTERIETNPVVAQSVTKEKQGGSFWLWLIPLLLILGGLLWYLLRNHSPAPVEQATAPAADQAAVPAAASLGDFVKRQLPGNVDLNVPANGVESRLLAFIQDPSKVPDTTTWFDFDRLVFDTSATTLRPESQEQLKNIAAILKAYPKVHIKVGGYTDSTGNAQQNLTLSQGRAETVVAGLTQLGVEAGRLEAKGYGDQYPVGDNATEEGRAKNRRVSMLVTQK